MTLNLTPILNKEEQDRVRNYSIKPFYDIYREEDEEELYNTAKALRKQNSLPKAKIDINDWTTAGNLIINKYRYSSPASDAGSVANNIDLIRNKGSYDISKYYTPSKEEKDKETTFWGLTDEWEITGALYMKKEAEALKFFQWDKTIWEKVLDYLVKPSDNRLKKTIKDIAESEEWEKALQNFADATWLPVSTYARLQDFIDDVLVKKPVASTTVLAWAAYYNLKELWKTSFAQSLQGSPYPEPPKWYSFVNAWENTEAFKKKVEMFWGTRTEMSDYMNFETAEEKRNAMMEEVTDPKLKADLEEIRKYSVIADVTAWIASWVMTWNAINSVAKTVGVTSKTWKILNTMDKVINPSLDNMTTMWVWIWAVALPYYELTWKWIWEDNQAANEWAMMFFWSAWLKLMSDTPKASQSIFAHPKVKEWVNLFVNEFKKIAEEPIEKFAKYSWAKLNIVEEWSSKLNFQDKTNLKNINSRNQALKLQQDYKAWRLSEQEIEDLEIAWVPIKDNEKQSLKISAIQENRADWIMYYAWKDKKGLSFKWTEEALNNPNVETFWVWVHMNPATFKKVTWEDLLKDVKVKEEIDPLKIEKEEAIVEAMKKADLEYEDKVIADKAKLEKEWYIERRARDLWMWEKKESMWLKDKMDFIWNRGKSYIWKNQNRIFWTKVWDSWVGWKLKPAQREAEKTLDTQQVFWKVNTIVWQVWNIYKEIWSDYKKFNQYLWQKSRYFKTLWEELKWNQLKTVSELEDWTKIEWTKDRLKMAWSKDDAQFSKIADRLHNLNKQVLEMEVEAWVRSQKEADNFLKNNPFYIPDKLEIDDIENLIRKGNYWAQTKIWRWLKGWSEANIFSKNSMENLSTSMAYRTRVAATSRLYNKLSELSDKSWAWIANIVKKWTNRRWYSVVETFVDWEKKLLEIPNFYKEALEKNDIKAISTFEKILRKPTSILKYFSTWPHNLAFQFKAPAYEVPAALMKNFSEWGSMTDYFKSMFRTKNSYMNTEEWKIAIKALLNHMWWDFSWAKNYRLEFNKLVNPALWENPFTKETKMQKFWRVSDSLWHTIELSTTRAPVFESQLKKMWIDWNKWKELSKKFVSENWDVNVTWLKNAIIKEWGDPERAWIIAREVFDYQAASSAVKRIAQVVPYFDIPFNSMKALHDMWESNPKKFLVYMWAMTWIAEGMYQYNYSWERWEFMRKQNSYVRNKVWLASIDEEAWRINIQDILWNKWQALEWIYPMIVNMQENNTINPWLEWVNRIVKDLTYFGDLTKPNFIDFWKTPPFWKQMAETAFNRDFFYDSDLIPDYKKDILETEQYDRYTNPLVIKMSRALALMTWWEVDNLWLIEGWTQISPKKLEKYLETLDPRWTVLDYASLIFNQFWMEWVTDSNVKPLKKLLTRVYRLQSNDDNISDLEIKDNIHKVAHRAKIRTDLESTKDIESLMKTWQELIDMYKWDEFYKSDYKDIIKDEIDKRELQIKYWMDKYYDSTKTSTEYAEKLARVLSERWIDTVQKEIDVMKEIKSRAYMRKVSKELDRIVKENNIQYQKKR